MTSAHDEPASLNARAGSATGLRYIASVLAGGASILVVYFGFLVVLEQTGHLPAPPIANNICIDEKLAFLRENRPASPNLLVIGSSVAWRHFDGGVVAALVPGVRPVNGAFCSLHANQSVFVANWLLDRWWSVRHVIMIASPQDFEACTTHPSAVFDRASADQFVFGGAWKWGYYFRFFDPVSLARNAVRVASMRSNANPLDSLVFTPFGDGPIITQEDRGSLEYGEIHGFDPSCFAPVREIAGRLASEGRRFVLVSTPLHPEWKRRYDPTGTTRREFETKSLAALAGTGGEFLNGDASTSLDARAFVDGIHLRWSAAQKFSEMLASEIRTTFLAGPSETELRVPR
jgi:hypothetical protein